MMASALCLSDWAPLWMAVPAWCCMVVMQLAGLARCCITGWRPSTFNSWSAGRSALDNWASLGWPFRKPGVSTCQEPEQPWNTTLALCQHLSVSLGQPVWGSWSGTLWFTTPIPLTCLSDSWTSHSHPQMYQTQLNQRNQIFPQCSPVILSGNNRVSHLKEFHQRAVSVLKLLFNP